MVIEAAQLVGLEVAGEQGKKLGSVETLVFNGQTTRLAGFGVNRPGLLTKTVGLPFEETLLLGPDKITVNSEAALGQSTKTLDELFKKYGRVIGVTAKTESGRRIGKIADVFIEAETGLIVRFYLRNALKEQIIPRQFLVALTPQQVVFKDVVDQPIFDQVATLEVAPTEKSLALSNE
ncbi:MAG TPA: PRC-barrel domain-containing protein [Candidatus Saccharimonadales bacterium]|nr:PRC-barrel domain-containing protein [Candidatus Saccharimonadales bacterium]